VTIPQGQPAKRKQDKAVRLQIVQQRQQVKALREQLKEIKKRLKAKGQKNGNN
jgi:small-conductance mechanosensitive channel